MWTTRRSVVMALHRADETAYQEAVSRATEWVLGMQSRSGGWGAFDADNEHYVLNSIPFADHGALLDPPTADVTARCLGMLAQLGHDRKHPAVRRGLAYLRDQQEADGSWFGRWGTNYVYGTWSVLCALNAVGEDMQAPYVRKAVDFIVSRQREDGGWGEDCASYWPERRHEAKVSTPSQTSWALLGLMAAGEVDSPAVQRGVDYLLGAEKKGDSGARNIITRSASRAYSTCAIMGIAPISRSGRSPATAISYAAIEKRRVSAFEVLLGVVTGLASERACLQRLPGQDQRSVRCFGVGPHAAEKAAAELLEEGCAALLSFGIAGGLDYRLRPGSLVLAEGRCYRARRMLRHGSGLARPAARLRTERKCLCLGRLLGSDRPLLSTSAKQAAASRLAAVAVDMEKSRNRQNGAASRCAVHGGACRCRSSRARHS